MKKAVAFMMCLALSASMLTGCGGDSKTSASDLPAAKTEAKEGEPAWKDDTDPITLDWYVNYSWYGSWWDEGEFSQYMESKTGVKINFIVPSGSESEKMNTMIAGNTLPDVITLEAADPLVKQMVDAGLLYPLNDLADKYDPYFYEVTSEQTMSWFAQADGKTYGYPNASISPEQYDELTKINIYQTFNVKNDYYEALGCPDMSTPENFLNALQAAEDMYGDQIEGFIPIALHDFSDTGNYSLDRYLMDYLGIPKTIDGKLYDRREDENYQTWLKTFRKANEMGLIASNVFTDSRQQVEEEIAQGRVFSLLYQNCDFTAEQQMLYDEDPNSAYIAIQGPNSGNDPALEGSGIGGWTVTCITKNCKDPERAIEFMTYWISKEGTQDAMYGEEGKSCVVDEDGTPHYTEEYQELYDSDYDAFNRLTGMDPLWMLGDPVSANNWAPDPQPFLEQMYKWGVDYVVSGSQYSNLDPDSGTEESEIKQDIDLLWGSTLPKLITAASDEEFDAILSDFFEQRDSLGWEKLLSYQQTKYEENLKKLGIEE
ncbi:MAG: extracellular solute-binding protein [Lachnospiraceae bacterium]|nr:extracellular solute-binding protein [Lachnospiraceae bacterium]